MVFNHVGQAALEVVWAVRGNNQEKRVVAQCRHTPVDRVGQALVWDSHS